MPNIILCADDYGFNQPISSGILALISNKRLSATSCMTNFPDWTSHADNLKIYHNKMDIGLHFNLTDGHALSNQKKLFSLKNIITQAYLKKLDRAFIVKEFTSQLTAFIDHLGFTPDFIDGHQHIQQLPIIREAIIEVYLHYFPNKNVYFRVSSNGLLKSLTSLYNFPKPILIHLFGAANWRKQLERLAIPHNQSFSGIYNFANAKNYRNYFKKFIQQINTEGLLMCHPGLAFDNTTDPIQSARLAEYNYFSSDLFLEDCNDLDVKLVRFRRVC